MWRTGMAGAEEDAPVPGGACPEQGDGIGPPLPEREEPGRGHR